ncbi:tripartite tricarboxylate transporter TctB family protein [Ureibacillus manganicus]|uniref:DUF1468 domain-containing protein n=1 Tax=Ureibacillus manganicus DSM 26584 TaxID=1384049 RepID=A0A0A3I4K1_9BACL|nr:tripartite tricarboxylate transporter TctB family protein [Ureibacillus manganicus]KGR77608.1 hypothetical protein CD29_14215 [Ureibacillus manganicus DSM 26584]
MKKEVIDLGAGTLLFSLATIGFFFTSQIDSNQPYGPSFFPKLILTLLMIASIILVVNTIFKWKASKDTFQLDKNILLTIFIFTGVLIGYVLLFFVTGFIISTIVFLLVAQFIFGVRKPVLLIGVSVILPILLYLIFTKAFNIPLPGFFE